jgi:hypothetical protein
LAATVTFSQAWALAPGASRIATSGKAVLRRVAIPICRPAPAGAAVYEIPGKPYTSQAAEAVLVNFSG